MQCLYTWKSTEGLSTDAVLRMYDDSVRSAYNLLLYQLFVLTKVAKHAVDDLAKRKAKLLPSDFDKNFTARLYNNPLMSALNNNKELNRQWEKNNYQQQLDEDFTRKLYKTFSLSEDYNNYILADDDLAHDRNIILLLYKDLCNHEFFNETVEDNFYNWLDDESIVIGTMKKILKALPQCNDILEEYGPSSEAVNDFGRMLLKHTMVDNKKLDEILSPLIQNWDIDRVALIDMILIKMSTSEMIHFPSIPTRVSINEYVELTKTYSTDKSKEFVNGVLDKVLHTLSAENKIVKSGRGLTE